MFKCQANVDPLREIEKRWKPMIEMAPNCPRCASPNTKFCYYNNYSLSQPRYFCKGCRRYWTKGGSLRNVPVGGGCRKNRRSKSFKPRSPAATHSGDSNVLSEISNNSDSASKAGSNIDLAAVFANFLNQNPAEVEQPDHAVRENVSESDLVQGYIPCRAEKMEEAINMGNEIAKSGPQKLLGDDHDGEVGQAVFWPEISAAGISWQQMAHLQDLDGYGPLSMNLVNDNIWSSFDFSGFEIFSRS